MATEFVITDRHIPLSQGKFAIVDDEDYDFLSQWRWYLSHYGYAVRSVSGERNKKIYMHREIKKAVGGDVDHVNGSKLDNRKSNLRTANRSQNLSNVGKRRIKSTSKFKGLSWDRRVNKWQVRICKNYKMIYVGTFSSEEDAALAYNVAALKHHGEFSRLNEVA